MVGEIPQDIVLLGALDKIPVHMPQKHAYDIACHGMLIWETNIFGQYGLDSGPILG